MLSKVMKIFLGDKHARELKKIKPMVEKINRVYEGLESLSDEQVLERSLALKQKISSIEDADQQEEACQDALPEAFALVKDACRRCMGREIVVCEQKMVWDMIPYDVQLYGAVVLHQGKITEMATGEGKTLVAVMPLYLNALKGRGVHLVTVNDYLARRDSEWMGTIFKFLGLSVGCIQHDMTPPERKEVYNCDVTYGTNNEFGFDYLRDNMSFRLDDRVQRKHHYAIVDEVDSVLIDEARTPLIISGPVHGSAPKFKQFKPMVENLVRAQVNHVNSILAEAVELLKKAEEEPDEKKSGELNYEVGIKLLMSSRGMPKNKRLLKLLQEVGTKKLMQRVEADYMRDKRITDLDTDLYFSMDEKGNQVQLNDRGLDHISPKDPNMFVLPDLSQDLNEVQNDPALSPARKNERILKIERDYLDKSDKIHTVHQLLKAFILFEKDVEYVVQDGKVMIVDEFTGRLMPGRRFSEGLHQSLEAKEGVRIEGETQTLATITLQNFFRLYKKLSGMTGTAETEANEFWQIYKLDVVVIPTNKPVVRDDMEDFIYRSRREKFKAIIDEIERLKNKSQPVLVGTISVDTSEQLSRLLKRKKISHHVLNAKYHQDEALIVAQAGRSGAVTIATNMAGRGTDIKLGTGVTEVGGLHILGTERHESRRIDLQLRGRSGRQGDPGSSQFFLSLEDDLMRLFGSERISGVMDRLGLEDGEVITHPLVSRSIGRAQKKVEGNNFEIRKHLLEYDDVMNQQREVIYNLRLETLEGRNLEKNFSEMLEDSVIIKVENHVVEGAPPEEWDLGGLSRDLLHSYLIDMKFDDLDIEELTVDDLRKQVMGVVRQAFEFKCQQFGEKKHEIMQHVLLSILDENWREHLYALDHLKSGINFRAYGQKDPLVEYKKEAFASFVELMDKIRIEITSLFFKARIIGEEEMERAAPSQEQLAVQHATVSAFSGAGTTQGQMAQQAAMDSVGSSKPRTVKRDRPKIGRNDPCYCGSGKKYKHCCGRTGG